MTSSTFTEPHPAAQLPRIDFGRDCLFLDFDGTLVDFAEHPADVVLPSSVRYDVAKLLERFGGALAVLSGRPISDIDHFFAPLVLPVAGVHGLSRRDADGRVHEAAFDQNLLERLSQSLQHTAAAHAGVLVEHKPGSLALHYRKRPELEKTCADAMNEALAELGPSRQFFHLMTGKMVIEARASDHTKANAVRAFMEEAPFAGRRPVFAGDDVTDEDGFVETNLRGGLSIKIGAGDTCAAYRFANISRFRQWLHDLAASSD